MRTFRKFLQEADLAQTSEPKQQGTIPDWILWSKFEQALEAIKNSKFFKGRKIDLSNLNLSSGQLDAIFGTTVKELKGMGIIKLRHFDDVNPFGGSSPSYYLAQPG